MEESVRRLSGSSIQEPFKFSFESAYLGLYIQARPTVLAPWAAWGERRRSAFTGTKLIYKWTYGSSIPLCRGFAIFLAALAIRQTECQILLCVWISQIRCQTEILLRVSENNTGSGCRWETYHSHRFVFLHAPTAEETLTNFIYG